MADSDHDLFQVPTSIKRTEGVTAPGFNSTSLNVASVKAKLDASACWKLRPKQLPFYLDWVQHPLTSNPCFSDGTHTSLFAAQSAWLEAEKAVELEVGDPGTTPDDRKRVTSLTLPPVGLDMVLLALIEERRRHKRNGDN